MTQQPAAHDAPPATTAGPGPQASEQSGGETVPDPCIVGIGASAGWFEAFTELLRALPPDTGMAYVLVPHLDPKHESQMAQVLGRMTPMPVLEAKDGMEVRPDHVYVIPAHSLLSVAGSRLHLQPRENAPPHLHVIDRFFRSLAEARAERAVGVVLSGTLSDGTEGLKAIRAAGGLTFAQSPESARYSEMPFNAISAGHVDSVLPPAGIAAELASLRGKLGRREPGAEVAPSLDGRELAELLKLLRQSTGVDFSQYRRSTLTRRIQRRMRTHRKETLAEYIEVVRTQRDEARALYEEILIHVTRFFREDATYQAIAERVLPGLVEDRPSDRPLRVWVPGCATGEEAYSIAIVILEFLERQGSSLPLQVFATDISDKALKAAREGLYPETISDDVAKERLLRWFEKVDGGYRISKAIRGMCVFAVHDLTADPPFSNMDLVSCRNVLVYMEKDLQRRVLATLHYALKPHGCLVLGSAESVGGAEGLFAPLEKDRCIFARKSGASPMEAAFPPRLRRAEAEAGPPDAAAPGAAFAFDLQREADRVLVERLAPAAVVVRDDLEVVQFRGETRAFLEHAPGPASFNLLRMARGGLAADLRAAIEEARETGRPARRRHAHAGPGGGPRTTVLDVTPIQGAAAGERFYAILFLGQEPGGKQAPAGRPARAWRSPWGGRAAVEARDHRIRELELDLEAARANLQSTAEDREATMEELRSANEEAVSSNEELQSTNEELETAKEELQSTNEELSTLNEELQQRNADVQRANNDLLNLLNSVNLAIVMVGPDLRIRRFTPRAQQLLNLIPTDLGRPLSDIRHPFGGLDLRREMLRVIESLQPLHLDAHHEGGAQHVIRMYPYRTSDNRVEGVVVSFLEVQGRRSDAGVGAAFEAAATVADTMWDPVAVLDEEFRLRAANRQFYAQFELTSDAAAGRRVFELGPFWGQRAVRDLLEKVLPERGEVRDLALPDPKEASGNGQVLVNARSLRRYGEGPPLILLAFRAAA